MGLQTQTKSTESSSYIRIVDDEGNMIGIFNPSKGFDMDNSEWVEALNENELVFEEVEKAKKKKWGKA